VIRQTRASARENIEDLTRVVKRIIGSPRLVVLVRHASRAKRWDLPESMHWMAHWSEDHPPGSPEYNAEGLRRTYALAGRLYDELENLSGELENEMIEVTDAVHSTHTVALQTAKVYVTVLQERSERNDNIQVRNEEDDLVHLDPETFDLETVIVRIDEFKRSRAEPNVTPAFIVVGHQPQLTQIARELGRRRPLDVLFRSALPGDSLPIENSEAACIRLGYGWPLQWHRPRLLWVLTAKPEDLLPELKDKIKSKYDVAKFFLGAFVVNIGLLLNAGIWDNINFGTTSPSLLMVSLIAALGICMALASLIFAAATLFSYDSLMMPESLWSESDGRLPRRHDRRPLRKPPKWSVLRPPSQAQVILFYEMMHVWKCFFMPAIVLAFTAIVLLICSLATRDVSVPPLISGFLESPAFSRRLPIVLVLLASLALGIPWLLYLRWRPRLGSED
jgi:phosphohistidine phosphatase SixA